MGGWVIGWLDGTKNPSKTCENPHTRDPNRPHTPPQTTHKGGLSLGWELHGMSLSNKRSGPLLSAFCGTKSAHRCVCVRMDIFIFYLETSKMMERSQTRGHRIDTVAPSPSSVLHTRLIFLPRVEFSPPFAHPLSSKSAYSHK